MRLPALLALVVMMLPTPATAAALSDAIHADMPQLMALYRDLHAHPELSMQEIRTPALLAPQMRKLGFEVTEKVGQDRCGRGDEERAGSGAHDTRRHGRASGQGADRPALRLDSSRASSATAPPRRSCTRAGTTRTWPTFIGTARRLVAMKDQWSGTLVMILQSGEETGEGAKAMLDEGSTPAFPSQTPCSPFTIRPACPPE